MYGVGKKSGMKRSFLVIDAPVAFSRSLLPARFEGCLIDVSRLKGPLLPKARWFREPLVSRTMDQ